MYQTIMTPVMISRRTLTDIVTGGASVSPARLRNRIWLVMMKLAVRENVPSTHLFPLPRSFMRSNRGENLLAMLPAVSEVRASTMLSPVKTSANVLSSEVRAWSTVIAKVSGSGSAPYRSIAVARSPPATAPKTAVSP